MTKLPPPQNQRKVPFLQREDWLISAGLVLGIYVIILIGVYTFAPDAQFVKWLVHLLLPIAAVMAWKGIKDRDENARRAVAIRAKRRHAEHDLAKLNKPAPAAAPADEEKKP